MTASEAIKILKKDSCYECSQGTDSPINCEYGECRVSKATRVAIKALEELEQYRAIGTPEECRAAVEKQKAKKMVIKNDNGRPRRACGGCGCFVLPASRFCSKCGKKLDWSDEE